jgi:uncharacterized iron-regulated protein
MRRWAGVTRLPVALMVAAVLVRPACSIADDAAPRPTDDAATLDAVARLARRADVIAIGEAHDNPVHHTIETRVLESVAAAGERPVLALEMLTSDQQAVIDAALPDRPSAAELDRRLAWRARGWPDFAMYYPLFEVAQRERLPVLAADLDPATKRTISRAGLSALPAIDRAGVTSRLTLDPGREAELRQDLQTAHCGLLSPAAQAAMAEAWHARNVTMARRIADVLAHGRKVVLVTGRAHLAADGIPGQLLALRPGTRIVVVDLVETPGVEALPNVDVVWRTPDVDRPDQCAELRQRHPQWQPAPGQDGHRPETDRETTPAK